MRFVLKQGFSNNSVIILSIFINDYWWKKEIEFYNLFREMRFQTHTRSFDCEIIQIKGKVWNKKRKQF